MRINYTEWWNDVVAILRGNMSIMIAVAGAFVFLPTLIASFVLVPLVPPAQGADPAEMLTAYSNYFGDNWLTQIATLIFTTMGQLLLYIVLLDPKRPPVGEALRMALPLFPLFLVTNILVSLIVAGGALLLIVPGLYLIGRVMLSAPAFVGERRTNPLAAVGRSFALTKGQGWRIFFFAFLVFLVAFVAQLAITRTFGIVLNLVGSQERFSLGRLLLAALNAIFTGVFAVLAIAIWVALYRRLTGSAAVVPDTSRAV